MTESLASGARLPDQRANMLLQVQYAFLELPKLPESKPTTGASQWAWLFVHAPDLKAIPADLPPGPYRAALELANEATFTQGELDAYRKVMDEIQKAREYGAAERAAGKAEGLGEGEIKSRREVLLRLLIRAKIAFAESDRARIQSCADVDALDRWIENVIGASNVGEVLT